MASVEVRFSALPAHVRTARLVASAVARRAGIPADALDEVRYAVGEACARAVDLHRRFAPDVPVRLEITDAPTRFTVSVIDAAPSGEDLPDPAAIGFGVFDPDSIAEADSIPDPESIAETLPGPVTSAEPPIAVVRRGDNMDLPSGFGLAVIRGLVDDVDIAPQPGGSGTRVCMSWPVGDGSVVA